MCRNNFIFLMIYIIISLAAGLYLASIILNLLLYPPFFVSLFINLVCVILFALFLLPLLNRLLE